METNYYKKFLNKLTDFLTGIFNIVLYTLVVVYSIQFYAYYAWRDAYDWWTLILGSLWSVINHVFNFLISLFN